MFSFIHDQTDFIKSGINVHVENIQLLLCLEENKK